MEMLPPGTAMGRNDYVKVFALRRRLEVSRPAMTTGGEMRARKAGEARVACPLTTTANIRAGDGGLSLRLCDEGFDYD